MKDGIIFDLQRYSVHDGPGIRTTIFIKGCPLNCRWCHNPESQSGRPEFMYDVEKCTKCQLCREKCPEGAIDFIRGSRIWSGENCIFCGNCVENCPVQALEIAGRRITTSELINEIEKDVIFYDESGGGVTFSGGEPFFQFEFIREVIIELKAREINVAVDTCGYTEWNKLRQLIEPVDIFLYDVKHIDYGKHKKFTGRGNELILDNLARLAGKHKNIGLSSCTGR